MIHLITGEYPPTPGGVADYSALMAGALVGQGERVHVWAPGKSGLRLEANVSVHRIAGRFTPADLARLDRAFSAQPAPRRLIVQWTPHSFGFLSMNVPFTAWLWKRAHVDSDRVELMVHEPFVAFGEGSSKQDAAAVVHRCMVAILLQTASKVWVSIPAWEQRLRPFCLGRKVDFEWLPVPSNIQQPSDAQAVAVIRASLVGAGQALVGHFGTFRKDIADLLAPALAELMARTNARVLLVGRGSDKFCGDFVSQYSFSQNRVIATGELPASQAGHHLAACDAMLQPYPDGISARRGTAMAALSLGLPLVSNLGHLSEPFWKNSNAVELASSTAAGDLSASTLALLNDAPRRFELAASARRLYAANFDLQHAIARLQGLPASTQPRRSAATA